MSEELANNLSNEDKLASQMGAKIESIEQKKQRRALAESGLDKTDIGWKPLPLDTLPSKGMFYEEGQTIRVKSAEFDIVKTYSLMNEEDPASVENGINIVLADGCKVSGGTFMDLTLADKLNTFFSIRDWTMMNTKSKNEVTMKFVSKTGKEKIVKVNAKMFDYYTIPNGVMKHYNKDARCFVIFIDEMVKPLEIRVPTVGVIEKIKKYAQHLQNKSTYDTSTYMDKDFLVCAQYLIKDWNDVDDEFEYMTELYKVYKALPVLDLQVLSTAIDKLKVGIKPTIKVKFDDGNVEVFPVTFREYKSLFFVSDKIGRLFGDD